MHVSQEEISSRISEVIDRSWIKPGSLGLHNNNIHIVICNDGHTVQAFLNFCAEKVTKFSFKADESIKLATYAFSLFTAILSILERMCFPRFVVDIFNVVFLLFFKCKN